MIHFQQVGNNPVWYSTYTGPTIDLSIETADKSTNRNKTVLNVTSENTVQLRDYLKSSEFKNLVIDTVKSYRSIHRMYPDDFLNRIHECTTIGFQFHSQPRAFHHVHLDYRTNIAQGLIYFDEFHNSLHATRVYPNYPSKTPVIESNTSRGNGILILNSHNSWHEGGNLSTDIRYFVLYSLNINV